MLTPRQNWRAKNRSARRLTVRILGHFRQGGAAHELIITGRSPGSAQKEGKHAENKRILLTTSKR